MKFETAKAPRRTVGTWLQLEPLPALSQREAALPAAPTQEVALPRREEIPQDLVEILQTIALTAHVEDVLITYVGLNRFGHSFCSTNIYLASITCQALCQTLGI